MKCSHQDSIFGMFWRRTYCWQWNAEVSPNFSLKVFLNYVTSSPRCLNKQLFPFLFLNDLLLTLPCTMTWWGLQHPWPIFKAPQGATAPTLGTRKWDPPCRNYKHNVTHKEESDPEGSEILDVTVKLFTVAELVLISTHSLHIHQSADCSTNNGYIYNS